MTVSSLPKQTASALRPHRRKLELERDALRAGAPELALASARGEPGAREEMAALSGKLQALQFEIDCNHEAYELASKQDAAAEVAWRAAIQTLDPNDIIDGLGKDCCPRRCTPGITGGCVLSAAAPHAGAHCAHPVKERHLYSRDLGGRRIFPHRDNPQASRVFDAALDRLKIRKEFA
jgi:hypothetical protein